ncbi:MAG: lycopene cyclase family protein [Segetibacter sp.]
MKRYDYIISGAGAAGLSLLMRFMQHSAFERKKILVVDKVPKNTNDRTWCFWEKQPGIFEKVVHHQWQEVNFHSAFFDSRLDLSPYTYKMIRGIDFYNYIYSEASVHTNVEFIYGEVQAVGNAGNEGMVIVNGEQYTADYVFNSIQFAKTEVRSGKYYLLQHFKGFVIETETKHFNPSRATLMDFRVSQNNGTSFVYVLPTTENKALVEYTVFSERLLPGSDYDTVLKEYISKVLGIEEYHITDREFGVIPMTNIEFLKRVGNVINIGTAGGQTKGSSGYTFQFIQKHSDKLINDLLQKSAVIDAGSFFKKRFKLYDSTLLNILSGNKLTGEKIFSDLFSKNPAERVLRFLDNETTLEDEINLMGTLPQIPFMKAAMQELFKQKH